MCSNRSLLTIVPHRRKALLDPFYLIVPDYKFAEKLVPLGVKTLQLRIKQASEQQIKSEIRKTWALCQAHQCQLIINDYWQLALEENCDFVHLGQEDLSLADIKQLKKAKVKFGLSSHSISELQRALSYQPDYIALGPIFPTLLKKMRWQKQGLHRLQSWRMLIDRLQIRPTELVAIGGFTIDKAADGFSYGANSIAVVTDIVTASDPLAQTKKWLTITEAWRKAAPYQGPFNG